MKRIILILFLAESMLVSSNAQSTLTIEKIMQGEKFTGYSPENLRWSAAGNKLYFNWRTDADSSTTLYSTDQKGTKPSKVQVNDQKKLVTSEILENESAWNSDKSEIVFSKNGDIFLMNSKTGNISQLTFTNTMESSPSFISPDRITYQSGGNLFSWDLKSGLVKQITDFRSGEEKKTDEVKSERDQWLSKDQMKLFMVLRERKKRGELSEKEAEAMRPERPKIIYTGKEMAYNILLSPDEKFVIYMTRQRGADKSTLMPAYVTESGYTETIQTRSKVGLESYSSSLYVYDIEKDTVLKVRTDLLPGSKDLPGYLSLYGRDTLKKKPARKLSIQTMVVSPDRQNIAVVVNADDRKDLWITLLDYRTALLKTVDRQHDEAWIAGPGIGWGGTGWLRDGKTLYFQSEESGFSHIYTYDITTGRKEAKTSGNYEIYDLRLSVDGKSWYFLSNETDHGINELYRMPVTGGEKVRLTNFDGGVEYSLSPDEKTIALRVSHANEPWELYLMENKPGSKPARVTWSTTPEFRSYNWRVPEFIRFKASDGAMVPARLYKPENSAKNSAAVIFVHGAGYLQNAHRWWSSYFREYMFHNFLVDNGYTVMDIDYRGSAGYGRDWRTAIYRHMGDRDLEDNVDGARYLAENHGIDPHRIGIYGGSYGGFMTLMALFTKPDVFTAGAALRPVTDWAHYSHGWTANILNTPASDSIAYAKSSPIYFAGGLKGSLLICHGMMDDNVHFQDAVRLVQRLIELGKDNWELAVYPLESHGFVEPVSWIDEYKRIFRLFQEKLK